MAGQGGNIWSGQTADGHARQHNGNVYSTTNFNYGPPGGSGRPPQQPQQRPPQRNPPRAASGKKQLRKEDYTVGWICALPVPEWRASRLLLDEEHESLRLRTRHQYVYGSMNGHNIVMGCLPETQTGTSGASSVASEMMTTFPRLRFGLLVGIAGGVPSRKHPIRLGDVVVSKPDRDRQHGGVVQYDYGKLIQGEGFKINGVLNQPPETILAGLGKVRSAPIKSGMFMEYFSKYKPKDYADIMQDRELQDRLFPKDCMHVEADTEAEDDWAFDFGDSRNRRGDGEDVTNERDEDEDGTVPKDPCKICAATYKFADRNHHGEEPNVYYGSIASGNELIRDAEKRDEIGRKHDVLCFEMEAAGLVNVFPCLVIRGICDYCDTHKNKDWQPLAAAAAAAWAKEFLRNVAPEDVEGGETIGQLTREQPLEQVWQSTASASPGDAYNIADNRQRTYGVSPSAANTATMATAAASDYPTYNTPDRSSIEQLAQQSPLVQQVKTDDSRPSATTQAVTMMWAKARDYFTSATSDQSSAGASARPTPSTTTHNDLPNSAASAPPRPNPKFARGNSVRWGGADGLYKGNVRKIFWSVNRNWEYDVLVEGTRKKVRRPEYELSLDE